ncbi:hypothetical protein [Dehalogenimonas formicexedens]|uniref:hypothetical protein n=1 Tax=Dehalogenimonas formicexedens TaxID=1839801 RepID=UPI0011AB2F18|nr:hypothetical protein [Dehalogenimonas formicexedens]
MAGSVTLRYCEPVGEKMALPDKKRAEVPPATSSSDHGHDHLVYTPENGLRLLGRMMAEAYLEELAEECRSKKPGYKRKLYIKRIQISSDCVDFNERSVRQKLHSILDKAIEKADREGLKQDYPLSLEEAGFSIKLKG